MWPLMKSSQAQISEFTAIFSRVEGSSSDSGDTFLFSDNWTRRDLLTRVDFSNWRIMTKVEHRKGHKFCDRMKLVAW